ncbi:MAG TPA: ABC transporter transmembrane domain-containing protein, partial [Magnetospirillum sp.]|nr:ABC transporter transmembrane domain-containing protein [Magnetospirillum sp.]
MSKKKISLDYSTAVLMRRLLKEGIRPYWRKVVLAVICMAVSAGATAMYAWLMDPIINKIFVARKAEYLWPLAVTIIVTFGFKGIADYGEAVLLSRVGLKVIADMQQRLFSRLMELDVAYFHVNQSGKLMSRLTNDVNSMRFAVSNALTGAGKDASSVVFLVGLMFYQDWVLSSLTFFVFPLAILPIRKLGRRMRKVTANTQEQ